jgi:hypothetical protein
MCVVIPHLLPKGGSGAAPLLDTPATVTRFMIRKRRRLRIIPLSRQRLAVGSRANETSAFPLQPIDQGLSCPWTHEQGLEISLSTCTEPWTNVRRPIVHRLHVEAE